MPGGVGRLSGDAQELPECEVKTLMTHSLSCAQLWVWSSRNWSVLTSDAT